MNQNRPDHETTPRIVTLDFNGGSRVYRNRELGMNIPVQLAPSGISADRAHALATALNRDFAGSSVQFEVGTASSGNASAVRIGRTDDFDRYGAFLGLAEGIGSGDAFVLLDDSSSDAELAAVIRHEAGHILGTLDHGGAGLARYAWKHEETDYFGAIRAYNVPEDWNHYLKRKTTTTYTYKYVSVPSGLDDVKLEYHENGTSILNEYSSYAKEYGRPETEMIEKKAEIEAYRDGSGLSVVNLQVLGCNVSGCSASDTLSVGQSFDYDYKSINDDWWNLDGGYSSVQENYKYHRGSASGCVAGRLAVGGYGTARQCLATSLFVGGSYSSTKITSQTGKETQYTQELHQGLAENCIVTGGTLSVEPGGVARDIVVRSGKVDIGMDRFYLSVSFTDDERKQHLQEYGNAQASSLIVEDGSVTVRVGGELHGATIDGGLTATSGAVLGGVITCKSVDLSDVTPGTNITIKLDLHDYAVPNYTEKVGENTYVYYYANYTTKTVNLSTGEVTKGTFDNKDGRFDMKNWEYTFGADIGRVDSMSVNSVVVDFGGTEKDFDKGTIGFFFPSVEGEIPFQLRSNKKNYEVGYSYYTDGSTEASSLIYNGDLFGDAADVLWLEYDWDEDVEYTVDLAPMMTGATEELTITNADTGKETMLNTKIQGATLVVPGGNADTADLLVQAEDADKRDHSCDLELIVVPETIPVIGKEGTKKYSEMLRKAQKTHTTTTIKDVLPYNIHTKFFGMSFDLTNMGISLKVDWTAPTMTLKLQGKMEWAIGKGTAGTGKQLKLVVDLSGENYISVKSEGGKTYSWDLVGELKVPDFKIGKFEFSNMSLKVNKGQSSFSVSAYVKLPWIKYSFGGSIGVVDGYLDSMAIGVDGLNVPFGSTGLFLQKIEGGISGIATELYLAFNGTLGLTAGPQFNVEYVDWLGIDAGTYSLCEVTVGGSISTSGDLMGSAQIIVLGGFASGGGSAEIKGGALIVKGSFSLLNGCISINGDFNAGSDETTISGKGNMTVPNELVFGPLAGLGLTVDAKAIIGKDKASSYVQASSKITLLGNDFSVGVKCTFDGSISLLGCTDLLKTEDVKPKRYLRASKYSVPGDTSVQGLRGTNDPSATETITVSGPGLTLFQVNLSVSDAFMSLAYGGAEYTQDAIAAGLYDNMQIVDELTGVNCITVAVQDAASGEWTLNAYGDAGATFGAYSILSGAQTPVLTSVSVGTDERSATLRYTADLSGLTNATLSVFRMDAGATEYGGLKIAELAAADANGVYEYVLPDEVEGGDYSFFLVVNSDDRTPVYSAISDAYTFRTLDLEAPDRIQIVNSEWKSSGTVLTWDEPWDDKGVAGYRIRYAAGDGDMTEVDVKTNTFTFDKVPNGTYDFQIAAYDAAGNLSAWSARQSCQVLTAGNALYKDAALTEDLNLAAYESAVNITAGDFAVAAAADSLVTGSVLGDAGISGIVEDTTINGTVTLYDGAQGYGLTVNGELTVGGPEPVPEIDITKPVPADGGGEGDETQEEDESTVTFTGATADGITVKSGGKLTIGADAKVRNVTVEEGGSLVLNDMADFDQISLACGTGLIVLGGKDSSFRLTGDIWTAGTLSTLRMISGGGHKIHFEQYKQTAEYDYAGTDYTTDSHALLPDMDKLVGKAVDVVIDSSVYGIFKIADVAEHFDGTITVTDSVDGTSAEVGFDKLMLVGNALCGLSKNNDGVLWLQTVRSTIGTPTLTVENADSDAYDEVYLNAKAAEDSGFVSQYTFRYSLNADMSDAVTITSPGYSGGTSISKYDLVDNATYYAQVCVENDSGVKSLWSDTVSFTVVPKLLPDAPTTLTVSGATNKDSNAITFTATGVDDSNYTVRDYRFRYADNPEMENAIVITTGQRLINYASIQKSDIVDGKDYYVQAGVKQAADWSYWSDIVVFNTQGWDYEDITIGPEPDGDYNYFSLNGSSAKNVTVIDGGYFYGGGAVDGLTVEQGGFFRDDNATVSNAVVNGGRYWLDSGSVTDIVVNGGELRLMNGTLNGATIGANASASLGSSYAPTITGTILIQGSMSVYYYHPGVSTGAAFVFDLGAHETDKDRAFIDYTSPLLGTRTFTVKLDDSPETGDYRMAFTPNSGEFYASLSAADGTDLGVMGFDMAPIAYGGLYYSLVDQKGVTYLHVSDTEGPAFIGAVKLSKGGAFYDSDTGYDDLAVSDEDECDYVLVGEDGAVSYLTVGNGGSADVYGYLYGATVGNGGRLTLKEGGCAASDIITVENGGNVTIEGGKVELGAAIHLAGGTLTVNGVLQGLEDDSGPWGPTNHWFVFELDTFTAAPSGVMISDWSLLQCNPMFTATVSPDQAEGEYKLAGNAAGFTGYISFGYDLDDWTEFLAVGNECTYGGVRYALAVKKGVLTLTVGEDVTEPDETDTYAAKSDIDGNGVSDVMFVWTGEHGDGNYQHGYWMNGTSSWQSQNGGHPAEWENLGCYDMTGDGRADSVLVGNVEVGGVKGAYIGYYTDAIDNPDGSTWVNIGYLTNENNVDWKNKVCNLTGGDANSIVWYAPGLYSLGAWTDGTDSWVTLSNDFGGDDWTMIGCGDFDGDGKDSVLMSGFGGKYLYAASLDGTSASLGSADWSGWDIRAIGDFRGDGRDDIVMFHQKSGSMVMCADGNIDNYMDVGQLDATDWFVVGCGDYNGDQQDDLLVRQYSTGMLGYYSSGDTTQWNVLGYGVDMNWTVIA